MELKFRMELSVERQASFPNEYKLACEAIRLIESELSVKLPASEQIFMTYHLLDAESDGTKCKIPLKLRS